MKKRKGLSITLEQADAHQQKHLAAGAIKRHGFKREITPQGKTLIEVFDLAEKAKQKKLRVGTRKMNQTEREFAAILLAQKTRNEILDFRFEGIRLPWGDGMTFKADFAVLQLDRTVTIIEVKGVHIWKHAIVRFKGCRAEWKEWFNFEFHQRTKDGLWHQLL